MARVYKTVQGVPGGTISRTLPNGDKKQSIANSVERVIALHEDVQRELVKHGMAAFRRAKFRLDASQQRRIMVLKEELRDAIKAGDPDEIQRAQAALNDYMVNKTQISWSQADIDFHIFMTREKGSAFHAKGDEQLRRDILKRSLTG